MNHVEHYHDWLRDAHAMEKQAESMLESMASRIDNYPDVRARIEQHINETKRQITLLEEILDRNDISRSVLKDSMSKMAALGQSRLSSNLNQLAKSANSGSLPVSPETEQALVQACEDVRRMRHALLTALGLRSEP